MALEWRKSLKLRHIDKINFEKYNKKTAEDKFSAVSFIYMKNNIKFL
jgi:hypothetical protein